MRARTAFFTGAATLGALAVPFLTAAPAGADTAPWPGGAVFVADQGIRTDNGGQLAEIDLNGNSSRLASGGHPTDAAVGADGTVYFTECAGGLWKFVPGSGLSQMSSSVGSCPTAVAIRPNGDLLVSSFSGTYDVAPDGTVVSSDPSAGNYSSLAVDGDDDVFGVTGGGSLALTPTGGSTVGVSGLFAGASITAVRLDGSGDLLASSMNGNAYLQSPSTAAPTTTYAGDSGDHFAGVAIDSSNDVFVSDQPDDGSTGGRIDVFRAGTTSSPSALSTGYDEPEGMAAYAPVGTPSRTASSIALSSNAPKNTTTASQVTLTATVDGGASGLTGLVQFASDGRPLGDVVPTTNGVAAMTTTLPAGEPDHVTATYLGSATERPSQAENDINVAKVRTTTTLTAPTTAPEAAPVQVSATVTGANGTHPNGGTVDFQVVAPNGQTSNDYVNTDANGTATASLQLGPGTSKVTAIFQSDGYYAQSQASRRVATTAPYRPTMTGTQRIGALRRNGTAPVTLQIVVKGVPAQYTGGTVTPPTGTVTADSGYTCSALTPSTTSSGTAVPSSRATCSGVARLGENYDVTVTYSGDSTYTPAQIDFSGGLGG